jgi:hypothetical protein
MNVPKGCPKLKCRVSQVRLTLSVREVEDDDLILFFAHLRNGQHSGVVKSTLHIGGVSLGNNTSPNSSDLNCKT